MKLTFVSPHKSITPFQEIELPDLVVLTGVNGAGKSHLLEAIENGCVRIDDIVPDSETKPIRRFDWTNLVPQDSGAIMPAHIVQEKAGYWNEICSYVANYRHQYFNFLSQFGRPDLETAPVNTLIKMTVADLIRTGSPPDMAEGIFQNIQHQASGLNGYVINSFLGASPINVSRRKLLDLLQSNASKFIIAFEEKDFYKHFPEKWISIDVFQQSIGRLFCEYQNNWLNNQSKILTSLHKDTLPEDYLSDEEFIHKYGEPPWVFINKVLESASIDFMIDKLPQYDGSTYEPILTDRTRGTEVKFADLSSGERVLMSFALCLYYAKDNRQIVSYPKVLLFDEIDAPLHPSMTQSLLRIVKEILIDRHKIKVILTTHSPSTVALSDDRSIFAMYKDGRQRIQKVVKDKALAILTNGVPTLSINYENRRQVFVESHYDVFFYEKIYKKLQDLSPSEISLNFISTGEKSGGCDRVKSIVSDLNKHGNKTVYGIIDWDLKNNIAGQTQVLGLGIRYSIENYIFDPLILAAFLFLEGHIERSAIGLQDRESCFDIPKLDNSRLQNIADFIVTKFVSHKPERDNGEDRRCEYVCEKSILLPSWFLEIQGHALEDTLKNIFPPLKRYQKEGDLKKEVIKKIIDQMPDLIPKDFQTLFDGIK